MGLDLKDKVFTQDYAKKLARRDDAHIDPAKEQRARFQAQLASSSLLDLQTSLKVSRIDVAGGDRWRALAVSKKAMANVFANIHNQLEAQPTTMDAGQEPHPLKATDAFAAALTQIKSNQVRQYVGTKDHDFVETKEKM